MFTKKILSIISGLENGGFGFLEILQNQIFFKNLIYTVFDREFQELSKSLFGFDPANGFRRKKL